MKIRILSFIAAACLVLAVPAFAGPEAFKQGQAIPEFGKIAQVKVDQPVYRHHKFKVAFDVSKQAEAGELNRNLVSAARFINMHTAAGVKEKNIKLAIVLHGGAAKDVTSTEFYKAAQIKKAKDEKVEAKENANAALVKTLIDHGVEFYVCGQTAAYYDIDNADLLPGVKMALSAMTAHALLQQKGYTLNPF
ncbi:MAG: DsrE family protein [Robiginitomaculum sp.]|nr:DsrE family protein [Robiginitomaculum sp.]